MDGELEDYTISGKPLHAGAGGGGGGGFVSLSSSVTLFLHTSTTFFLNIMSQHCERTTLQPVHIMYITTMYMK